MSYVKNLFKKSGRRSQRNYIRLFLRWIFKKIKQLRVYISNLWEDVNPGMYSSIDDLPQWNWNMIHKTQNLGYLKKLKSYREVEVDNSQVLIDLWHDIYNEYLEEFGLSKEYRALLEKKKQIARMKIEYIQTDNKSLLNFIKIEEIDLAATFDNTEGLSFEQVVDGLERIQKQPIDVKKITVYKYNNYIRTLKDQKNV